MSFERSLWGGLVEGTERSSKDVYIGATIDSQRHREGEEDS